MAKSRQLKRVRMKRVKGERGWTWRKLTRAEQREDRDERRMFTERHLRMTIEDWRLKKRQEWRAVMSALELFTFGSAYTPTGNDLYELQRSADRIARAMKDDWVCW